MAICAKCGKIYIGVDGHFCPVTLSLFEGEAGRGILNKVDFFGNCKTCGNNPCTCNTRRARKSQRDD